MSIDCTPQFCIYSLYLISLMKQEIIISVVIILGPLSSFVHGSAKLLILMLHDYKLSKTFTRVVQGYSHDS